MEAELAAGGVPWPVVSQVRMAHLVAAICPRPGAVTLLDCPPSVSSHLDKLLRQADLILSPRRPALVPDYLFTDPKTMCVGYYAQLATRYKSQHLASSAFTTSGVSDLSVSIHSFRNILTALPVSRIFICNSLRAAPGGRLLILRIPKCYFHP